MTELNSSAIAHEQIKIAILVDRPQEILRLRCLGIGIISEGLLGNTIGHSPSIRITNDSTRSFVWRIIVVIGRVGLHPETPGVTVRPTPGVAGVKHPRPLEWIDPEAAGDCE